MTPLDNYQSALLAAFPEVADAELASVLEKSESDFTSFVIDHGLGPLWHERTGRDEFHECRLSAEALYLVQEHALKEIDRVLEEAGIEYAVIKGGASRLLLYDNPAIRTCYDLDLLVRAEDRLRSAAALVAAGYIAEPDATIIGHELVLSKGAVDVDLHWGLLREGRLRNDCASGMLERRYRSNNVWMLSAQDALFVLLVHPAFAKHLAGWEMGLHRIADIVAWLDTQSFDWEAVRALLDQNGVKTAAWSTLHWLNLLTCRSGPRPRPPVRLDKITPKLQPGPLRRSWLNFWLQNDLSTRMSGAHWARLFAFSLFLHDTPRDALRALAGRYRATRRSSADLEVFRDLLS